MATNKQLGMLIDLSRCIGCNACVAACKVENDVLPTKFNTSIVSWDVEENGKVVRANLPRLCNHCESAPCEAVCPTQATYTADEGVVLINKEECIGCLACMKACPYDARYEIEAEKKVGKCTYCYHRSHAGLLPACVSTCVTHARTFGDLNDKESDISKRIAEIEAAGQVVEMASLDSAVKTATRYLLISDVLARPARSAAYCGSTVVETYQPRI